MGRNICTKPDSVYAALANTMERWFIELRCNNRMLINLTSPNDIYQVVPRGIFVLRTN
jgi:hypothetical protein